MRKLFCILVLLISVKANAQNLVVNPGFEDIYICPTESNIVWDTVFNDVIHWGNPTNSSPDIYNTCVANSNCYPTESWNAPTNMRGFQYPIGSCYAGILFGTTDNDFPNQREYIRGKFNAHLDNQKTYCISAYLSPAEAYDYSDCENNPDFPSYGMTGKGIGMYLADTLNYVNTMLLYPASPQIELIKDDGSFVDDTSNWTLVTALYTAQGNEKYFILGNFKSDAQTELVELDSLVSHPIIIKGCYFYIDNVSVFEVKEPLLKADTLVCNGDTATLTIEGDVLEYWWYEQDTPNTILGTGATLKVSPWQTTIYTVKTKSCSVVFEKNITVTVCNNQPVIKIYPNPAQDFITINLQNVDLDNSVISMYNAVGQLVYKETIANNQFSISTSGLAGGLYTLDISQGSQSIARQKVAILH